MSSNITQLEDKLADLYKSAPDLPKGLKDGIVQWLPWLSLVGGILALWSAYNIYHWASVASTVLRGLDNFYGTSLDVNRWSAGLWLAVIALAVEGVIYLVAFSGLKNRKKAGWNLLFLGALLNIVYGIFLIFTLYSGISGFILSLIGSAIGLYFLFQIRDHYKADKASTAPAPTASHKK